MPRADTAQQIYDLEAYQLRLAQSLRGTSLSFEAFVPLLVKYSLDDKYPSSYRHLYLRETKAWQSGLANLAKQFFQLMKGVGQPCCRLVNFTFGVEASNADAKTAARLFFTQANRF